MKTLPSCKSISLPINIFANPQPSIALTFEPMVQFQTIIKEEYSNKRNNLSKFQLPSLNSLGMGETLGNFANHNQLWLVVNGHILLNMFGWWQETSEAGVVYERQ